MTCSQNTKTTFAPDSFLISNKYKIHYVSPGSRHHTNLAEVDVCRDVYAYWHNIVAEAHLLARRLAAS